MCNKCESAMTELKHAIEAFDNGDIQEAEAYVGDAMFHLLPDNLREKRAEEMASWSPVGHKRLADWIEDQHV